MQSVGRQNRQLDGLLKGKVCFVTGAGRGIGRAILERFVMEGAEKVYANTFTPGRLDDYCAANPEAVPLYFDVSDGDAVRSAMLRVRKECGRLDVLVNNAGIAKDELIGMISRRTMEEVFAVNVFGAMEMLQAAARLMMKTGGSIINISSSDPGRPNPGQLVYKATKGAIEAMTKTAAFELGPRGIRVNAIAPTFIDTDMARSVNPDILASGVRAVPMGRIGRPDEVASACVFLASEQASYVSGHILEVDGAF